MPIKFRDLTRSRTLAARRAADFGADKPFLTSGEYESKENCDFYTRKLLEHGFRNDIQINVVPLTRSIPSLTQNVDHLMKAFSYWWGGKNFAWVVEQHGPESEPRWFRERGWFGYFAVIAPLQEDHGSHAHIIITEKLTAWDEYMLAEFGERLDLTVNVSRNSAAWLRKKRKKNSRQQHKCRVEYTVHHLRRAGSDLRMSRSQTPDWVRGSRERFLTRTRHMLRNGARCIAGSDLRTDFSKTHAERKLIADDLNRALARQKLEKVRYDRDDREWLARNDRAPRNVPQVNPRKPLQLLRKGAAHLKRRKQRNPQRRGVHTQKSTTSRSIIWAS